MLREEKIEKALDFEKQIKELTQFGLTLRNEVTSGSPTRWLSFLTKVVHQKTTFLFKIKNGKTIEQEIKIPEQMVIEIAALTRKWIAELENRANNHLNMN